MPFYKYPIVLWTDHRGNTTACTADGVRATAVDVDDASAINQLKKYLVWHYKKSPYADEPDFREPQVETATVNIRAQYQSQTGRFPSDVPVKISFPYVWGKRADDSIICCLPTFGQTFHCTKESSRETIVKEEIQKVFADATTSAIARSLSPLDLRTEMVNVRVPRTQDSQYEIELSTLPEMAVALGQRDSRRQFSRAWQRDPEVNRLKQELKNHHTNVLLEGKPGIGKTTVLAEAVRQLRKEQQKAPDNPDDDYRGVAKFWLTNAARLIAGMSYLGEWEERAEAMVEELAEINGVLCIENLLALIQTGDSEPNSSLAAFFRYFMLNNELRMVAETNAHELSVVRRLLPGLDSMFQIIHIEPMSSAQAQSTLTAISQQFTQGQQLEIDDRAAAQCYYLFERFLPYDDFPGKCALFWKTQLQNAVDEKRSFLGVDDIISGFVSDTGLPEFLVRDEIPLNIDDVIGHFEDRIVGQPAACRAVAQTVMNFKSAMNDPQRPIGVQLFCGPTGVGKTELAKTLAAYLFGASQKPTSSADVAFAGESQSDNRLIRLDMSEYASPGAAEKLLLDSCGGPSPLVQKIRQTPFVVLLLDEIEKASPEVFDALMTMFDEGRMVDRLGREANFCSAVVILTSNLGTSGTDPIGFGGSDQSGYEKEVRQFFRPEFFNRLDAVITFDHLSQSAIQKIAEKEIKRLGRRDGLANRNIRLTCSPAILEYVAELGYDRRLGARPLQRTIETKLVGPLARWMVENPTVRDTTLTFVRDEQEINLARNP